MKRKALAKALAALAAALLLCMFAPPTRAGTATASLDVSVVVDSACQVSTTAVSFPVYMPIGTHASSPDDNTAGSITVTCTVGAASTVAMNTGSHASGTQARMSNGAGSYVNYDLYQDASRTASWGSSGAGLFGISAAPSTAPRTYPVYARIPAEQSPASGTHTDTVTATVNF